ncbi:S-adenosylmethionine-dependent methyltransferase [Serendipita sp. 401]|nr:S-adenosylmethionine-dependent methyltransferase [Serendipita sp. 401]
MWPFIHHSAVYCCTDINHAAVSATQRTAAQNKVTLDVVQTSLVSSLDLRCRGAIDILLFNPPYVPTEDKEVSLAQDLPNISSSWAGGAYGMDITQIVLRQVGVGLRSAYPFLDAES